MENTPDTNTNRTRIIFDLAAELTPEELAKFEESARVAGAESLTEHFLNLSIRVSNQLRNQPAA